MYRRARIVLVAAALLSAPHVARAQLVMQPTPAPLVTAQNEPWFRAGSPIEWSGALFYPAGASRAFDPSTMATAGSYQGIPFYTDSAQPGSVLLIPISDGRVQPYRPLSTPTTPVGVAGCVSPASAGPAEPLTASAVTGTTGRIAAGAVANGAIESALPPKGLNNAFIDYDGRRWIADGKATATTADMQAAGTYHGFIVYTRGADRSVMYLPSTAGLVVPFRRQ